MNTLSTLAGLGARNLDWQGGARQKEKPLMNKQDIKRVLRGQLASYLRTEVIIDEISEEDVARTEAVQGELARGSDRRCNGGVRACGQTANPH
jgi:hypothetical protein